MTTAAELIDVARSQLGFREGPGNDNPYDGHAHQPWCGSFVAWCFAQVGMHEPSSVYVPNGINAYQDEGRWHDRTETAEAGWLVYYQWPGSHTGGDHVGIVVKDLGTRIQTIEGNTSPDAGGSQGNGGGVYLRTRYKTSVMGYGAPHYTDTPAPAPPTLTTRAPMYEEAAGMNGYTYVKAPDGKSDHWYSVRGSDGMISHNWFDGKYHGEAWRLDQCKDWPAGTVVTDTSEMMPVNLGYYLGFTIRVTDGRRVLVYYSASGPTGYSVLK